MATDPQKERKERKRKTRAQKKEAGIKKPKNTRYALKIRARERLAKKLGVAAHTPWPVLNLIMESKKVREQIEKDNAVAQGRRPLVMGTPVGATIPITS